VVETENWHGGLAMGYLWSRMVCFAGEGALELSATSQFADMLSSFSTISQEKRHETLPSWLAPLPVWTLFSTPILTDAVFVGLVCWANLKDV